MATSGGAMAQAEVDSLVAAIEAAGFTTADVAARLTVSMYEKGIGIDHQRAARQEIARDGAGGGTTFGTQPQLSASISGFNEFSGKPSGPSLFRQLPAHSPFPTHSPLQGGNIYAETRAAAAAVQSLGSNFRTDPEKHKEYNFIVELFKNESLYRFVQEAVQNLIIHGMTIGLPEAILKSLITGNTNSEGVIIKIGFIPSETDYMLVEAAKGIIEFRAACSVRAITFMQLTGIIYNFSVSPTFVKYCIKSNKDFQAEFIRNAGDFMGVPPDITFKELESLMGDSDMLYFWIWNNMSRDKATTLFSINQNKNPEIMATSSFSAGKSASGGGGGGSSSAVGGGGGGQISQKPTKKPLIYPHIKALQLAKFSKPAIAGSKEVQKTVVVLGSNYNMPVEDAIWFKLMQKYGKEIIAGQSASATQTYRLFFKNTTFLDSTPQNKVLVLLAILADYSFIFHSFSEILQAYMPCMEDLGFKYFLSSNDLDFILHLITHVGLNEFIPIFPKGRAILHPGSALGPSRSGSALGPSRSGSALGPSRSGSALGPSRSGSALGPSRSGSAAEELLSSVVRPVAIAAIAANATTAGKAEKPPSALIHSAAAAASAFSSPERKSTTSGSSNSSYTGSLSKMHTRKKRRGANNSNNSNNSNSEGGARRTRRTKNKKYKNRRTRK